MLYRIPTHSTEVQTDNAVVDRIRHAHESDNVAYDFGFGTVGVRTLLGMDRESCRLREYERKLKLEPVVVPHQHKRNEIQTPTARQGPWKQLLDGAHETRLSVPSQCGGTTKQLK